MITLNIFKIPVEFNYELQNSALFTYNGKEMEGNR